MSIIRGWDNAMSAFADGLPHVLGAETGLVARQILRYGRVRRGAASE